MSQDQRGTGWAETCLGTDLSPVWLRQKSGLALVNVKEGE